MKSKRGLLVILLIGILLFNVNLNFVEGAVLQGGYGCCEPDELPGLAICITTTFRGQTCSDSLTSSPFSLDLEPVTGPPSDLGAYSELGYYDANGNGQEDPGEFLNIEGSVDVYGNSNCLGGCDNPPPSSGAGSACGVKSITLWSGCNVAAGYGPICTSASGGHCVCKRACPIEPQPCWWPESDTTHLSSDGQCAQGFGCGENGRCVEGTGCACDTYGECATNAGGTNLFCDGCSLKGSLTDELCGDGVDNNCDGNIDETDCQAFCDYFPFTPPNVSPYPIKTTFIEPFDFNPSAPPFPYDNVIEGDYLTDGRCGFIDESYDDDSYSYRIATPPFSILAFLPSHALDKLISGDTTAERGRAKDNCLGYDYGCDFLKWNGVFTGGWIGNDDYDVSAEGLLPPHTDYAQPFRKVYSTCWNEEDFTPGELCNLYYDNNVGYDINLFGSLQGTMNSQGICLPSYFYTQYPCQDNDGDGYCRDFDDSNYFEFSDTLIDCDDNNADVYPGAEDEYCNIWDSDAYACTTSDNCNDGLDNDCDGYIDDLDCDISCTALECMDNDGDGYGYPGFIGCQFPEEDCDDSDTGINHGVIENCENGIDDNCDGLTDEEDLVACPWSLPVGQCGIGETIDCLDLGYTRIIELESLSNARVQLLDLLDYDYAVCCNLNRLVGPAICEDENSDGIDDNLFIRLQGNTNSKVEVPYLSNPTYNEKVCISDFECVNPQTMIPPQLECPAEYNIHMMSITGLTDAYAGEFGTHDHKICCKRTDITVPYCGNGVVDDGEDCDSGTACIMEGDAECSCEIGYRAEGEGYNGCVWEGAALIYWSEDNIGTLQLSEKDIIVGTTTIYLIANDINAVDGTQVEFEIYENDIFFDDNIRTGDNKLISQYSTGKAVASWTISVQDIENARQSGEGDNFEFYFTAVDSFSQSTSDNLDAAVIQSPVCATKERCMDYTTQTECENDENTCQVADNSIEGIDCSHPNIDCYCEWSQTNNVCAPGWGSGGVGTCSYEEITSDDCGDMFLTYSWIATWLAADPFLGDPQGLALSCVDGSSTVPCPAQIQLSFFNYYNLLAVVVLIALIYFLIGLNKKRPKRKVKKKKKK